MNTLKKIETISKMGYRVTFIENPDRGRYSIVIYKGIDDIYRQSRASINALINQAYKYIISLSP